MNNEMATIYSAVEKRKTLQSRRNFKNMEFVCAVRIFLTAYIDKEEEEAVGGGKGKERAI